MMTSSDRPEQPRPNAPGYGDQGPAGGGRDGQADVATENKDKPEPVDDRGGRA